MGCPTVQAFTSSLSFVRSLYSQGQVWPRLVKFRRPQHSYGYLLAKVQLKGARSSSRDAHPPFLHVQGLSCNTKGLLGGVRGLGKASHPCCSWGRMILVRLLSLPCSFSKQLAHHPNVSRWFRGYSIRAPHCGMYFRSPQGWPPLVHVCRAFQVSQRSSC